MKRTTIFVPEALERELQLYADLEQRPTAVIVREALAEYLARRQSAKLPSFAGAFASGRTDTAERHEELLFAHLAPHGAERRRASSPRPQRRPARPPRRRS